MTTLLGSMPESCGSEYVPPLRQTVDPAGADLSVLWMLAPELRVCEHVTAGSPATPTVPVLPPPLPPPLAVTVALGAELAEFVPPRRCWR